MLRPRRRDDAGVTLAEVLVGMTIGMIVMTIAMTFFVNALQQSDAATEDSIDTAQGRTVLDGWAAQLRQANWTTPVAGARARVSLIKATEMSFYTNAATGTGSDDAFSRTLVDLALRDGALVETRTTLRAVGSTWLADPTTTTSRVVAGCSTTTSGTASGAPSGTGCTGQTTVSGPTLFTGAPAATCTGTGCDGEQSVTVAFTLTAPGGRATHSFGTTVALIPDPSAS